MPAGLDYLEDLGEIPIPYILHLFELINTLQLKPRSKQLDHSSLYCLFTYPTDMTVFL